MRRSDLLCENCEAFIAYDTICIFGICFVKIQGFYSGATHKYIYAFNHFRMPINSKIIKQKFQKLLESTKFSPFHVAIKKLIAVENLLDFVWLMMVHWWFTYIVIQFYENVYKLSKGCVILSTLPF